MLKDITLGQYFPGNSAIHKMDPRVKIMLTLLYMVLVFVANNALSYLLLFCFLSSCILISKISMKFFLKGLRPLIIIICFTGILNMFMTPGDPLFSIWKITATREGLSLAVFMILRIVFLIMGTSLLTYTTSPILLTDGIEKLLNPFRKIGVPAHELAMMMTIALRFISTLIEETDKIMKAQSSRGADFESGNLIKRAKSFIPLLVPLFINAFKRAEELAMAMECRCYHGGENRTRMRQLKTTNIDYISVGIFVLVTAGIICLRFVHIPYLDLIS